MPNFNLLELMTNYLISIPVNHIPSKGYLTPCLS